MSAVPEPTKTPRTDEAKRQYDQWASDCHHPNRHIRTIAQTFNAEDGWDTARKIEAKLQRLARVAGEAHYSLSFVNDILCEIENSTLTLSEIKVFAKHGRERVGKIRDELQRLTKRP